jgi:hypothetical protein
MLIIIIVSIILLFCLLNIKEEFNKQFCSKQLCLLNPKEEFKTCRSENCGYFSPQSCSKCKSCGWCIGKTGNGQCVASNAYGPYHKRSCVRWSYKNTPFSQDYGNWYHQYGTPYRRPYEFIF